MNEARIKTLLKHGEGINIEFKECKKSLNKDIYETVCAFLNRCGGELLLGVKDNGEITGIEESYIEQIKNDFTTSINNPQKISPPFYLTLEELKIDNYSIIYIYIPESSQVHRCNGKIYDRNEDGDFNITENTNLVTALYLRKQTSYSENKIYPFITMAEFRADLITRVRKLAVNQRPDHPWASMTDKELLKSSQLFKKDYQTGKEGYTLAAILLLAKDDVILSVLPHHKTDAILRKDNPDRYDDRDDIRTNLIESYDRLMTFIAKNLQDKFYMEGDQRISIRDHIFREIITNILIHREYINPFPAKLVIEKTRIFTENSNKPHGHGLINISDTVPFPKNPVIASFFRQIGRAEELGSGFKKLFKYSNLYFGTEPEIREEDIFRMELSFKFDSTMQATMQATMQDAMQATMQDEQTKKILEFCNTPKSRDEIQEYINIQNRDYFRKEILKPLIEKGFITPTILDKPNSPNQKYVTVKKEINDSTMQATMQATMQDEQTKKILEFCNTPKSRDEIQEHLNIQNRDYFRKEILKPLIEKGVIAPTILDKPNSPNQKYMTVIKKEKNSKQS